MSLRLALFALVLAAPPLAAQQSPEWDPDKWNRDGWASQGWDSQSQDGQGEWSTEGWSPQGGWEAAPLENLPPSDEMLDAVAPRPRGRPLDTITRPDPLVMQRSPTESRTSVTTWTATGGAVMRGLDKVSGETVDLTLGPGQTGRIGRLEVTLKECRFPQDNPASDAFAYLTINDPREGGKVFAGWMIASSPALNPLDDLRYDVWVLRCKRA